MKCYHNIYNLVFVVWFISSFNLFIGIGIGITLRVVPSWPQNNLPLSLLCASMECKSCEFILHGQFINTAVCLSAGPTAGGTLRSPHELSPN